MLVRAGADRASVTASFEFARLPAPVAEALDEADIVPEPGEPLMIRRQVRADGGSKAFVNDQPASVALLRRIAPALVELHGQHDDRGLVNPRGHRALLDRYAGADTAALAAAWDAWRAAEDRLQAARDAIARAREDQDLLLAHLAELTALEPQAGKRRVSPKPARRCRRANACRATWRNCATCGTAPDRRSRRCGWRRAGSTGSRLNTRCSARRWPRSTAR